MTQIPAIDYQVRPTQRMKRDFARFYVIFTAMTLMPVGIFVGFLLAMVPVFRDIFRDFRVTLPAFTEWTLVIASYAADGFWLLALPLVLAPPLIPARVVARQEDPFRATLMALLYLMLMALLFFGVILAMFLSLYLPLAALMRSISGVP